MISGKTEQMIGVWAAAKAALESIATACVLLEDAKMQLEDMETPARDALSGCEDARTEETIEALRAAADYTLRYIRVIIPEMEDRAKTLKTAVDITRAEIVECAENERRNWYE